MTYFEHTKRDLAEARKEIGELMLALADDTARKMNGETAGDPDAEHEYDRTYLLEDLITRLVELAHENGADRDLFSNAEDSVRHTCAYPLLDDETYVEGEVVTNEIEGGESTQDLGGYAKGVALYSSRNVKTSRPGFIPTQGITKVEEDGIRWDG